MEGMLTLVLFAALVLMVGPPSAKDGESIAQDATSAKKSS
jgi:hypothetical protein